MLSNIVMCNFANKHVTQCVAKSSFNEQSFDSYKGTPVASCRSMTGKGRTIGSAISNAVSFYSTTPGCQTVNSFTCSYDKSTFDYMCTPSKNNNAFLLGLRTQVAINQKATSSANTTKKTPQNNTHGLTTYNYLEISGAVGAPIIVAGVGGGVAAKIFGNNTPDIISYNDIKLDQGTSGKMAVLLGGTQYKGVPKFVPAGTDAKVIRAKLDKAVKIFNQELSEQEITPEGTILSKERAIYNSGIFDGLNKPTEPDSNIGSVIDDDPLSE